MIDLKILGNRIKKLRLERGLTQSEFADIMSVSFQAVSNWERGIAPPDLENLVRISSYFGVLADYFLSPESNELYLGIDGGGTKTEFAVVSAEGFVKKQLLKSGCNPNDIGYRHASEIILDGIGEILTEFPSVRSVFCGIAGITAANNAAHLYADIKKRYPHLKAEIQSDSFNLFAMDDTADMAIISGTGSVVFVKDGDKYARLGGWGYLIDEAGSAFDIGRAALRVSLGEQDSKKDPSIITKKLCARLGVNKIWDSIGSVYSGGKAYIASLSSCVFDAYKEGDENAISIIDANAKALAHNLNEGILLYSAKPTAVASGGIFEHYSDIMLPHLEKYTQAKLLIPGLPPVYGACRRACIIGENKLNADFLSNFKKTYGDVKQ